MFNSTGATAYFDKRANARDRGKESTYSFAVPNGPQKREKAKSQTNSRALCRFTRCKRCAQDVALCFRAHGWQDN
jgi:hypothetical protein